MEQVTHMGKVGFAVVVHGREIDEFPHSDGRTYVWCKHGTEYSIVVWNFTSRRIEAVISVDGIDACSGKTADHRTDSGYIVGPHTKVQPIPGFRLSDEAVANFTFGAPEGAYAALTDRPANIGVIGVAFYPERRPLRMPRLESFSLGGGRRKIGARQSFGSSGLSASKGPSAGTEFGRQSEHRVHQVHFTRENQTSPLTVLALGYETKDRLREMGIEVNRRARRPVATPAPTPFPGSADGCPPPAGWDPRRGTHK